MNFHSSLHAHHLGAVLGTGKRKKSWTRAVFSHLQRKGLEKRFQVKRLKTYLIFLSICGLCKYIFFSMLALLRTTSFLTTIYGPYSSHHYTHVTNYNFSHAVPLWAGSCTASTPVFLTCGFSLCLFMFYLYELVWQHIMFLFP